MAPYVISVLRVVNRTKKYEVAVKSGEWGTRFGQKSKKKELVSTAS